MKRLLVLVPILLFVAACDDNAGATQEVFVAPRDMAVSYTHLTLPTIYSV